MRNVGQPRREFLYTFAKAAKSEFLRDELTGRMGCAIIIRFSLVTLNISNVQEV